MPTIYLVDDDASGLDSMAIIVRPWGFEAKAFHSGEDFLASANPQWEGCLPIDFNLGTMTAVDFRSSPTIRVIAPAPPEA